MWQILLVVACFILAAAMGLVGAFIYRYMRRRSVHLQISEQLERVRERIGRVSDLIPERRDLIHSEYPAIEVSATIEAWLLQDKPKNALVAATHAVSRAPKDGRVYLHLARTLLLCDEPEFAARALARARELGENSPASTYLDARVRLSLNEMQGSNVRRLQGQEAVAILELLLNVVEQDPAFGDAAYHAGLLAIHLGFEEEGRRLLRRVEPLMEGSAERSRYLKDLERFN